MPKVFVSYSHDSPEHSARVLEFANALRAHGVDAELDQYHVRPEHGWPHWCAEQLREENGEFVLLVCTETYRQRVENKAAADEGRGVYWEGAIIYDYLYDAKGNRRFIPILLGGAQADSIPQPIRNHTRYSIAAFNLDDDGYQKLYRELTEQPAIVKPPLGETITLGPVSPILSALPVREVKTQFASPVATVRVSLGKLPQSGATFLGRGAELQLLDEAWADSGRTHVVVLVASGGVGKTTLVKRWLDRVKADHWRGAECVYGWSFYSQGASDDRQASDDAFLNDALRWFAVEHDPALSPWDKGRLLAEAVTRSRTLLVLDGLEPLQYPPGPLGGALRAPGVQSLLRALASARQPGLCVVTTREAVGDLAEYERTADHPAGGVLAHDLGNLDEMDGARLLYRLGVTRAGAAAIAEDDAELRAASGEVRGHALALTLLGSYLTLAHGGDIRQRDRVRLHEANAELLGGHAFKVMEGYERWFASAGEQGARGLAPVRLLGLFDRPADAACLAALRAEPAIAGLTDALFIHAKGWSRFWRKPVPIDDIAWNITLQRLAECGLIEPAEGNCTVDAHPLVREYFAKQLRERHPAAWREGHRRLYEYLKSSVPYQPEELVGLDPLYQAVAHGCKAGLYREALVEVYRARIIRGDEFYSTRRLGAFGSDLAALSGFFDHLWDAPRKVLPDEDRAFVLECVGVRLRGLGRLSEAIAPMRAAAEEQVKCGLVNSASRSYGRLNNVLIFLGELDDAWAYAMRSRQLANESGDPLEQLPSCNAMADVLIQMGRFSEAEALFVEAERIRMDKLPDASYLHWMRGIYRCELLLSLGRFRDASALATERIEWAEIDGNSGQGGLLDLALDYLASGMAELQKARDNTASNLSRAETDLDKAVALLRRAGQQQELPRGLLGRAALYLATNNLDAAQADIDEAQAIARSGAMLLYQADCHLAYARLCLFRGDNSMAQTHWGNARQLVIRTSYQRRDNELRDVEQTLVSAPG